MSDWKDRLLEVMNDVDEEGGVSVSGLTAASMRAFGGEEGFARRLVEIVDTSDSSQAVTRVMSLLTELAVHQAKLGDEKNISRLSDEELREGITAALPTLIEEMAQVEFGETYGEATVGALLAKLKGAE